jgi:hypothetical protein
MGDKNPDVDQVVKEQLGEPAKTFSFSLSI